MELRSRENGPDGIVRCTEVVEWRTLKDDVGPSEVYNKVGLIGRKLLKYSVLMCTRKSKRQRRRTVREGQREVHQIEVKIQLSLEEFQFRDNVRRYCSLCHQEKVR